MGIQGLLPLLRSITRKVHLQDLAGQSVAVDAYSWLHKAVYGSCAVDLFHGRENTSYIDFCISRVQLLMSYNVKPIMVFDGARLPIKSYQEVLRSTSRDQSRRRANEFLASGDSKSAYLQIQKSVDITPKMAALLMKELRNRFQIQCIVAPYEADAQMAWLDRMGKVAAIVTEDSDLLLFGCKRVLYKLDKDGFAEEIMMEGLPRLTELDMSMFSFERFRHMCMLSGCDYLPSIYGLGIKTAHRYLSKYKEISRVFQVLRAELPTKVPESYEENFGKAELTFIHQRVYDTERQRLCFLNPLPAHIDTEQVFLAGDNGWDFLGPGINDESVVKGICEGHLCPTSFEPFFPITIPRESAIPMMTDGRIALGRIHGNRNEEESKQESIKLQQKTRDEQQLMQKYPTIAAQRITSKRPLLDAESIKENNHSSTLLSKIVPNIPLNGVKKGQKFAYSTSNVIKDVNNYKGIPRYNSLLTSSMTTSIKGQKSIKEFFKSTVDNDDTLLP